MSAMPPGPGRPVAESIRLQLGTDALVLITPGRHSCAVVISSVPGYPSRLTDARAELDRESADDDPRLAYTVTQAARALGLSKSMIYDQLRSRRLGSVRVGKRRIITASRSTHGSPTCPMSRLNRNPRAVVCRALGCPSCPIPTAPSGAPIRRTVSTSRRLLGSAGKITLDGSLIMRRP